jgi:hypothetical protein
LEQAGKHFSFFVLTRPDQPNLYCIVAPIPLYPIIRVLDHRGLGPGNGRRTKNVKINKLREIVVDVDDVVDRRNRRNLESTPFSLFF